MKYPLSISAAVCLMMTFTMVLQPTHAGQHPKIPHAYEAEEHAHRVYHEKKNDPNHQRKKEPRTGKEI